MNARPLDRALVLGLDLYLCTSERMFTVLMNQMLRPTSSRPDPWCPFGKACHHTVDFPGRLPASVVCIDAHAARFADDPILAAAVLVHEATHAKQRFMEVIGERSPSTEFEAYAMQNLTENLLREYHRQMF